jgi:hypothetical protein
MKKAEGPGFQAPGPREDVRVGANRCPFCRDGVAPEESVVCQGCLTRHHKPCWEEGSGCSSCQGTSLLEPPRERLPEADPHRPTRWTESDGRTTFAVTFKGRHLRASENPFTTRLTLSAGDTLLAEGTRSWSSVFFHAFLTWFGKTPTWEIEGKLMIDGTEHSVKAIHHVTFRRWYVQIYGDGELLGPELEAPTN